MPGYDYNLSGVRLHLDSVRPMQADAFSKHFRSFSGGSADIRFRIQAADEIAFPAGVFRGANAGRAAWQDGGWVSRCCRARADAPLYFCARYHLGRPQEVDCTVRAADWDWATRSQHLWPGLMVNTLLLHFQTLLFHASYIFHAGRGLLFTAPSGTGKSTQAGLWRAHRGAQVLNGDKAAVRLEPAPMAHGVPFAGTSGICRNVSVPLTAVVVLSQAPGNTVRRLSPSEAVAALCPNVFIDSLIPEEWQLALHLLLDLAAQTPVYALACTPDVRAVQALEDALAQTGKGGSHAGSVSNL